MFLGGKIDAYYNNHMGHVNKLCGKNEETYC
jgi:hypothetical protein